MDVKQAINKTTINRGTTSTKRPKTTTEGYHKEKQESQKDACMTCTETENYHKEKQQNQINNHSEMQNFLKKTHNATTKRQNDKTISSYFISLNLQTALWRCEDHNGFKVKPRKTCTHREWILTSCDGGCEGSQRFHNRIRNHQHTHKLRKQPFDWWVQAANYKIVNTVMGKVKPHKHGARSSFRNPPSPEARTDCCKAGIQTWRNFFITVLWGGFKKSRGAGLEVREARLQMLVRSDV